MFHIRYCVLFNFVYIVLKLVYNSHYDTLRVYIKLLVGVQIVYQILNLSVEELIVIRIFNGDCFIKGSYIYVNLLILSPARSKRVI